jgi:hypothetical protein
MHDRKEETMLKDIKEYSAEEVGLWVTAQGLDPSKFVSEGVDGDLLLSLSIDDLKNDLGLSSLQAKKVMKNIEFSKSLTVAFPIVSPSRSFINKFPCRRRF